MTPRTISIGIHRDFMPELRDRILKDLRERMNETSYRLLTPSHLRALAELESSKTPILSQIGRAHV